MFPDLLSSSPTGPVSLDAATLRRGYRFGSLTVRAVLEEVLARIDRAGDDAVWISRVSRDALFRRAAELEADPGAAERLPLYGLPFAVKDNIDVAGLVTTAGCQAYAYDAVNSASVVARILDAGAVMIGKTNLDQFATGLAGTRSPFGVPRNPFDPRIVPGGSSSGSGVAVASGLVSFALGTDTAGSGRVPAALNNIVGLKPTRGLVSTVGVVPACRSLDCVSIFALTCEDAARVLDVVSGPDACDPWARARDIMLETRIESDAALRIGVPRLADLEFHDDEEAGRLYAECVQMLRELGFAVVEVDLCPFVETGGLLYGGPWVAERLAEFEDLLARDPSAVHPVTREVLTGGARFSAMDAFRAQHQLAELKLQTQVTWGRVDVLCVPTIPTRYSVAELESEPITCNARLGHYTTFANLLDLAAIAIPNALRSDGTPVGIMLIAPARSDGLLLRLGSRVHAASGLALGATGHVPTAVRMGRCPVPAECEIAVVGAHLSGEPLNGQLTDLGARLVRSTRTHPAYRLYELAGEGPARPGLVRVGHAGVAIELEVWALRVPALGVLLAQVPAPLTIGTVELEDGSAVKGFLCEAWAADGAHDISRFGGWRAWRQSVLARAATSSTKETT